MTLVRETVLIVDDDEAIRQLERRILEDQGYRVIEASNGLEGIERLTQGIPMDLVIADLEMPELGGDEMVQRLMAINPQMKVLYVTGKISSLMNARRLTDNEAFLEKPFGAVGLTEAVSQLLHNSLKGR